VLSTVLAGRQIVRERRRLHVIPLPVVWVESNDADDKLRILEVLEVQAHCAGSRPVMVYQAGVITQDGTYFHPQRVSLSSGPQALTPPAMLHDGETATFYFDLLSFEGRSLPKAVWVEDAVHHRWEKRLSKKRQGELQSSVAKLRQRLGPDLDSQTDLPFE